MVIFNLYSVVFRKDSFFHLFCFFTSFSVHSYPLKKNIISFFSSQRFFLKSHHLVDFYILHISKQGSFKQNTDIEKQINERIKWCILPKDCFMPISFLSWYLLMSFICSNQYCFDIIYCVSIFVWVSCPSLMGDSYMVRNLWDWRMSPFRSHVHKTSFSLCCIRRIHIK